MARTQRESRQQETRTRGRSGGIKRASRVTIRLGSGISSRVYEDAPLKNSAVSSGPFGVRRSRSSRESHRRATRIKAWKAAAASLRSGQRDAFLPICPMTPLNDHPARASRLRESGEHGCETSREL